MLHTVLTVSSRHTVTSFSPFKPSHPSSFTFYMDQPNLLHLKLKHSHQPHLTCQASSHQHVVANAALSNMNPVIVAPRVGIIMDSDSDLSVMKNAAEILEMFGVPHEVQTVSAHRTPELMFSYASSARERGIQVIIGGAGGAAHLSGMVAAMTPLPVIGVPVRGSSLDGLDSLLSIVQMPRGVPVATVAIDNGTNAGLLAVRVLGVADDNLLSRMSQYQEDQKDITIVGPSLSNLATIIEGKTLDDKTAVAPRVGIIMGSDSDLPVMKSAAEILEMFGVPHEVRIVSAHRTPEMMFSYASSARERGIRVIIAGAGGAAHLPGMVAAITPLPVIGVPVRGSSLDGIDSLLSIVQMPPGAPVATVAVNNATNAGLLAVRMFGFADDNLLSRMSQYQEDQKDSVLKKGDKLEKLGWESYLNS